MADSVFIDAGAWVALAAGQDTYHREAVNVYAALRQRWPWWVTTNLVVGEAYPLILRRGGRRAAMRFLAELRDIAHLERVYSDAGIETLAEGTLRHYADQDFSFVDAVSFTVMRLRGIDTAFAFDHHFQVARFGLGPGLAAAPPR